MLAKRHHPDDDLDPHSRGKRQVAGSVVTAPSLEVTAETVAILLDL